MSCSLTFSSTSSCTSFALSLDSCTMILTQGAASQGAIGSARIVSKTVFLGSRFVCLFDLTFKVCIGPVAHVDYERKRGRKGNTAYTKGREERTHEAREGQEGGRTDSIANSLLHCTPTVPLRHSPLCCTATVLCHCGIKPRKAIGSIDVCEDCWKKGLGIEEGAEGREVLGGERGKKGGALVRIEQAMEEEVLAGFLVATFAETSWMKLRAVKGVGEVGEVCSQTRQEGGLSAREQS